MVFKTSFFFPPTHSSLTLPFSLTYFGRKCFLASGLENNFASFTNFFKLLARKILFHSIKHESSWNLTSVLMSSLQSRFSLTGKEYQNLLLFVSSFEANMKTVNKTIYFYQKNQFPFASQLLKVSGPFY